MNSKNCLPTGTFIDPEPHASYGIGKSYPYETQEELMWTWTHHYSELSSPHTLS